MVYIIQQTFSGILYCMIIMEQKGKKGGI